LHLTTKSCRATGDAQIGLFLIMSRDVARHHFIVCVNRPLNVPLLSSAGARPRVPLPPAAAEGACPSARERAYHDPEVRGHAGQAAVRARAGLQRRSAVAAGTAQTASRKFRFHWFHVHSSNIGSSNNVSSNADVLSKMLFRLTMFCLKLT
jgi:hypothetical protein